MKKRFFSKSLYFDALKQTRIIGILCLVVFIFISIQAPITIAISEPINREVADFYQVAPILVVMPYLITPILCLIVFGFMNKRKSSDFYHSIADTRTCLYISMLAAVITWIVVIMALTIGVSLLVHLIFSKYFVLNMNNILINALGIFSSSIYSAAIVTIAMSLTGTVLTNVAVSALLLFLPDFIITLVSEAVLENLPIMANINYCGKFMPIGFNIVSLMFLGNVDMIAIFHDLSRALITLALSVIAIVISVILFKNRKSETAGYPTQNKYLQAAFRIICSFVVTVFGCVIIFTQLVSEHKAGYSEMIYLIALIYIAAILVYFICELVTTRKFKNLPRTIPGLAIVLVLNVALIGIMYGAYNINLSFSPEVSEIDYIRIPSHDYYADDILSYYNKKTENIKLEEKEIKEIVCDSLKTDIKEIKNGTYYNDTTEGSYYESKRVIICVNGKEYIREIKVSESKNKIFAETLKANEDYQKAYKALPALGTSTSILYSGSLDEIEDAERIYNLIRKELAGLDFETWYSIVNGYAGTTLGEPIYISTMHGTEAIHFYLPIYLEFEESATEYIKLSSDKDNEKKIMESADNVEWMDHISATITYGTNNYYIDFTPNESDKTNQKIKKFLSELEPSSEISKDSPIVTVYVDYIVSDDYGEWWETISAYFNYTGDIEKLLEEANSSYTY